MDADGSESTTIHIASYQADKHGPVAHCEGVAGAAAGDGGVRRRLPGEHAHLPQEHRVCQQQHLLHPCGQH